MFKANQHAQTKKFKLIKLFIQKLETFSETKV